LRQQFPNWVKVKPSRPVLMVRRSGQEDRVPMIRWIATVATGAALSAALVGPAPAAPQSAPATSQSLQQGAPDADSPAQPAAPPARRPRSGGSHSASWEGNVMRGSDTASLVAMLPWWRTDASRAPGSDPGELESPILTACDVWLGFPFATADVQSLAVRLWEAQNLTDITLVTNKIRVADAGELNEIDLAAPDTPQGSGKSWLGGLLALLGGALAAFSAVRYLVA
jgi:hypothetical protein